MKNPFQVSQWSVSRVILVLWIIFSVVYIANDIRVNTINAVYNAGVRAGGTNAVVQMIEMGQQCQPVVLTAGENQVNLVNPACEAQNAPAQQVTPPAETTETEE
ncbi:hypothetical protein K9M59_04030 [Candidatus Gracilibacteria bacterium]|nr:hypothetical protein [Candidatus Gracilibacteria bacterium]MCF7819492.1 hypothetical protein [Candidatus Gracilibacteria bacterium]